MIYLGHTDVCGILDIPLPHKTYMYMTNKKEIRSLKIEYQHKLQNKKFGTFRDTLYTNPRKIIRTKIPILSLKMKVYTSVETFDTL